ncbi:hypothetical protein M9H77_27253 [Catharanthus roseus]|uniref:Uncharacterized protein n=1 Tax=Catharanthus roseus TaxID=4058 RepID=A0ACC0ADW0_CATRO|nr:hypothetical protein M9H77_27253 [Catharanthus roseus]
MHINLYYFCNSNWKLIKSKCASGSSTQPPPVPFRSRPPLPSHPSYTPVPYEPYGSSHPPSHSPDTVYDPYLHAPTVRPHIPYRFVAQKPLQEFSSQPRQIGDSSYSTYGHTTTAFGFSSSEPYIERHSIDRGFEGDRGLGEEHDRVRSLHIEGEADERLDDDGDDDDHDDGEDAGDEEQHIPVAPASGSDGRPRHKKGKGLTGSFMSVVSKISGSRNKRPDAWIYMYFPMFASTVRPETQACKPYIQQYPMGYKNEHKLLDIRLRLDMMTADEVRWTPYRMQEIRDCWISTRHGFIAYFDCVEPYMPDRLVR